MGRRIYVFFCLSLVIFAQAQDSYHEALLKYFEQEERLERGSGGGPDMEEDQTEDVPPVRVAVQCLRCSRDDHVTEDACSYSDLKRELKQYTVECVGHCMNLSAGKQVEYGCADDEERRPDRCLERAGTRICVCSDDMCNAPENLLTEEDDYFEINTPRNIKAKISPTTDESSSANASNSLHLVLVSVLISSFSQILLHLKFVFT